MADTDEILPPETPPETPPPGEDRSWIPEEFSGEKCLDAIADVPGAIKGFVESQKFIGGSVRIPKEDATPEEIEAFHTKMGRPETPEGYGITKPDTLPEGVTWDEGLVDWFSKAAHGAGLNKAQAEGFIQAWNDQQFNKAHEGQKAMKAELDVLRDSWGAKFDGNVELGLRGVERLLPNEEATQFKTLMESTGLGNNPIMLKFAYQVGNMLKADGYIMGDGHGGVLGAEGAKAKIAEINADLEHPWHKGDKAALAEMDQLFKTAYPK